MKKFDYAQEFTRTADVARIGNADDVRISYSVFVGNPESEGKNFLDNEFFSADDFTTWSDAAKAKIFAATVLAKVDEHIKAGKPNCDVDAKTAQPFADLLRATFDAVNRSMKFKDDKDFAVILHGEIAEEIFNTYNKYFKA